MKLSIIVAATLNNAIGKNNQMLWNLPEDMRFFKNITWGFPLIMGRKTFEALGNKPLPGRFNIVISRQSGYKTGNPEVQQAISLIKAIDLARKTDSKEAFIGGGGQIYKESLLLCDTIYMTRVMTKLDGDAFFPEIPENIFQLTHSKKVTADDKHAYAMDFQTWTKNKIDTGTYRLDRMYSKSRLAYKWLQYFIRASNSRGHGIHSPFVFELVSGVLNDRHSYDAYKKIERIRIKLQRDNRILRVTDPGAGSGRLTGEEKKIAGITATAVSTKKFGRLLFRLANYYQAHTIIELGTSLGISTAYLASANGSSRIITLEGSPEIASVAKETFQQLELNNIDQVVGGFDDVLADTIRNNPAADLVFLDGNHKKKPVLDYFEQFLGNTARASMIIIHDIHWSTEMEEAWSIIRQHPKVKMSIDIFSAGLVFFREEFQVKQHFTIRF